MHVKIDTKEKFHAITILEPVLAANMTEELDALLLPFLTPEPRSVIVILKGVQSVEEEAGERLVKIQDSFYENALSFVICELEPAVEEALETNGLLEVMNVVPTETEAGDIVLMEEVERELLNGEE
ncbi:MAG: anti-anti-sigma factor [Puia sp.]|nr:anti-anti-sigma factor [Puia sp.]